MNFLPPLPPNFDAALRDVRASDPRHRLAAAIRLGEPPEERRGEARDALAALLADELGPVRNAALNAYAQIGPLPESLLDTLLIDPHEDVRATAVALLPRGSRESLRRALEDDASSVRVAAVFATAGRDSMLCSVVPILADPEIEVREALADALEATEASAAIPLLEELLVDADLAVRRAAALTLAAHGDATGGSLLIEALDHPAYRDDAARALGQLGLQDARDPLRAQATRLLLPLVSRAIVGAALVRLGDPQGVISLRLVLRAWRSDGRAHAVELCGECGVVELLPELLQIAKRPRGVGRETLLESFERLSPLDSRAGEALRALVAEPHR